MQRPRINKNWRLNTENGFSLLLAKELQIYSQKLVNILWYPITGCINAAYNMLGKVRNMNDINSPKKTFQTILEWIDTVYFRKWATADNHCSCWIKDYEGPKSNWFRNNGGVHFLAKYRLDDCRVDYFIFQKE